MYIIIVIGYISRSVRHLSWGSQLCNTIIIVYGFIIILFYHALDIIYYIRIITADVCTHNIYDWERVSTNCEAEDRNIRAYLTCWYLLVLTIRQWRNTMFCFLCYKSCRMIIISEFELQWSHVPIIIILCVLFN